MALNDRLIGPKHGTELFEFMEPKIWCPWMSRAVGWLIGILYVINYVLVCIRPEMTVKFGFTK